ncbi:hypothetical protein [Pseudomonas sp. NA-150]|uniref:hypothetical protein n=1 Tax=Pseudomonas sp. NA-150 TaxID=3367525 RepID=UPI0037C6099F
MLSAKSIISTDVKHAPIHMMGQSLFAFNPSQCQTVFNIGLCGDTEHGLLSGLWRQVSLEMPGATVVVRHMQGDQLTHALSSGEINVGLSYRQSLPDSLSRVQVRSLVLSLLRSDRPPQYRDLDPYRPASPALKLFMLWRDTAQADAAQYWLRAQIQRLLKADMNRPSNSQGSFN